MAGKVLSIALHDIQHLWLTITPIWNAQNISSALVLYHPAGYRERLQVYLVGWATEDIEGSPRKSTCAKILNKVHFQPKFPVFFRSPPPPRFQNQVQTRALLSDSFQINGGEGGLVISVITKDVACLDAGFDSSFTKHCDCALFSFSLNFEHGTIGCQDTQTACLRSSNICETRYTLVIVLNIISNLIPKMSLWGEGYVRFKKKKRKKTKALRICPKSHSW